MAHHRIGKWIGVIVIAGLVLLAVMLFRQTEAIKQLVLQRIDATFGQSIRFHDLRVSLFPIPSLELEEVIIRPYGAGERASSAVILRLPRIQVDMGFLSLFTDDIHPTRLVLQKPRIQIVLAAGDDERGTDAELALAEEKALFQVFSIVDQVAIIDGALTVLDEREERGSPLVFVDRLSLALAPLGNEGKRHLTCTGVSHYAGDVSTFSFQGTLGKMKTPVIIGSAKPRASLPNMVIAGDVEVANLPIDQLVHVSHMPRGPELGVKQVNLHGTFRLTPGLQGYDLSLSQFNLNADALSLSGSGNISGVFGDESPTVALRISTSAARFQDFINFIPKEHVPASVSAALDKGSLGGRLMIQSVRITGTAKPDIGFSVVGEAKLTDGILDIGKQWGRAVNIAGNIQLESDRIRFSDITALYDEVPILDGEGIVALDEPGLPLETTLRGEVPVAKVMSILQHIFSDSGEGNQGWWSFLSGQEGGGLMSIRFHGPLATPDLVTFRAAEYRVAEASLELEGVKDPLRDIEGTIRFSPRHIAFDSLSGRLGLSKMNVQGSITFEKGPAFDQLVINSFLYPQDFFQRIWPHSESGSILSGNAELEVQLNGLMNEARIHGFFDLGAVGIEWPEVLHKEVSIPGTMEFEGMFQPHGKIRIDRIDFSILPLDLSGRGTIRVEAPYGLDASYAVQSVDVQTLPDGLTIGTGSLKAGVIESSGTVSGVGWDWRLWEKSGWLAMTNGVVQQKGLDRPAEDIYLRVQLRKHQAELKRLEFRMGDSRARVTGMIRDWDRRPQAQLRMQSPRFDLDLLIPKGARSPIRDILEQLAADSEIKSELNFSKAWYKELNFEQLTAHGSIGDGVVDLSQIQGKMGNGTVGGRLYVELPRHEPATVKTRLDLQTIPLEPLQRTFLDPQSLKERMVTGWLTASGVIEGHGYDPRGVMPTIKGKIDAAITDGYIQRGTIVPRVLTLLHLPRVLQGKVNFGERGFPIEQSRGTLIIDHGIIKSDDIVLTSPILTMTGAGSYSLLNHHVDVVIAVSPLGPYSNILRKIPLFGVLLEGDREAIDTAMFSIQGSIHQPDVTYLPLKSFQAGLKGLAKMAYFMLKNTVTLPTKLLRTPERDNTSNEQKASSGQ